MSKKGKLSYSDIAVLHLFHRRGELIAGYSLSKSALDDGWCGPSTERRLREISATGYHIIKGVKYFVEEKLERGYICYRVPFAEKQVTQAEVVEVEGRPMAVVRQLTMQI